MFLFLTTHSMHICLYKTLFNFARRRGGGGDGEYTKAFLSLFFSKYHFKTFYASTLLRPKNMTKYFCPFRILKYSTFFWQIFVNKSNGRSCKLRSKRLSAFLPYALTLNVFRKKLSWELLIGKLTLDVVIQCIEIVFISYKVGKYFI